ncbi:hypothetical protein IAU60_004396 [Kwoniella sp. DSM 27419]
MIAYFAGLLPPALALLWTSYDHPTMLQMPGPWTSTAHSSSLSTVLELTLDTFSRGHRPDRVVKLTMAGRFWEGTTRDPSHPALSSLRDITPFLVTYPIYFGLLIIYLLLGTTFHLLARVNGHSHSHSHGHGPTAATASDLGRLRWVIVLVMALMNLTGTMAIHTSALLYLVPCYTAPLGLLTVRLGYGSVLMSACVVVHDCLSIRFVSWSRELIMRAEGGISLDGESSVGAGTEEYEAVKGKDDFRNGSLIDDYDLA